MAANFKAEFEIPFLLLVDQEQETYAAMKLPSDWFRSLGPRNWLKAGLNLIQGHPSKPTKLDMTQLGGVMVVEKGGKAVYLHRAEVSSDNPPVEELLAALP